MVLTIYDPLGRVVKRFDIGHQRAGIYRSRARAIHWDGRDKAGESVASGAYFYTLQTIGYVATRHMVILR